MAIAVPAFAQGSDVTNGGFETGDLSGWSTYQAGQGGWYIIQAGDRPSFCSASATVSIDPSEGSYALLADMGGGNTTVAWQDIVVSSGTLSVDLAYDNLALAWIFTGILDHTTNPNQHIRIDIMDPASSSLSMAAGDIWATPFETTSGSPYTFSGTVSYDISAWVGQTVRVRKMVLIEVRGVKFPAYMDQIDFPYFKRFTEKKLVPEKKQAPKTYIDQVPKEKPQPNHIQMANGVWLTLVPKFALDDFNDEVVELLKIYLVNRTDKAYRFVYKQQFFNETNFELENEVLAFHDFYLHDIPFEAVNDSPSFSIDFSLVKPEKRKASHFETQLKLKTKQLFRKIEELKSISSKLDNQDVFHFI